MKKEPVWVGRELVIAVHERVLRDHGGAPGILNETLLESALVRPQQLYHYEKADHYALAAAYAAGIAWNHAFADGIKRTAFVVMCIFLIRNGTALNIPPAEAVVAMVGLADKSISEKSFARWLESYCK